MGRRCPPIRAPAILACAAASAIFAGCLGIGEDEPEPEHGENLIVSVGDSVAAGQGNPAPDSPRWLSHRCYRSTLSGHWIAGHEVIDANPDAALDFVSLACSGATIDRGLLGAQRTGPFAQERPQLDRLEELAGEATVEALMISVGANDVGFSRIVIFCAGKEDCPDSRDYGPAKDWARENGKPVPTLREFVARSIAELPGAYRRVEERIPAEIPRERVLLVEYFDPTRWPARTPCAIFRRAVLRLPIDDLVTREESRWAHDEVLIPLNEAIHESAGENGWTVVKGVDERFDGHGICAPSEQRWIRTLGESLERQHDPLGALHPNEAGHRATAALIAPALAEALGL